VFEVVEAVKQVSGADFTVRNSGRRPGDPASLVAATKRTKAVLGWTPKYDDLPTIVGQALDWERRLHNKSAEREHASFGYPDAQRALAPRFGGKLS
jgi:UDP-glucose 4-epimerase